MNWKVAAGFAGFFVVLSAGVLNAQSKPDLSKPPGGADTSNTPNSSAPMNAGKTPEGVGMAVDPNKYLLGSEDVVFVRTWRENDFTFVAAVRPDGMITAPLIGDVQAAGLTPLQLTNDLKTKFSKYINNPEVTVMVQEVRSKKYFIDGEVNRPGSYALVTPTTVLEALSIASGFKEFADRKHVKILRGTKTFRFNYNDVTKGKHSEENILLENGDHVIIP